jgi:hypothetical protein
LQHDVFYKAAFAAKIKMRSTLSENSALGCPRPSRTRRTGKWKPGDAAAASVPPEFEFDNLAAVVDHLPAAS